MTVPPTPRFNPGPLSTYFKNTEQLDQIFDLLADMIQVIDAKTRKPLYVNKSLLTVLGYSVDEIVALGPNWPEKVIHPVDRDFLSAHLKNLITLKKSERSRVVYRALNHQGKWRRIESVNSVLSFDDNGDVDKVVGFTQDITVDQPDNESEHTIERLDVEHRCKNCRKLLGIDKFLSAILEVKCGRCGEINAVPREELETLFLASKKKFYITNKVGKILYINDAVLAVSGYHPSEVLGMKPSVWGGQMSREFYVDLYKKILDEKRPVSVKLTNKKKNGELYPASVQISPILDEDGEVEYFLTIEREL